MKDILGVDPSAPFNMFAHAGAADGEPEPRTAGGLTIELDPRSVPMLATISDEGGNIIAQTKGLAALLAYCGRWNADTQLLDVEQANGTLAPHNELFSAYHAFCLSRYRSLNRAMYRSYEAAGLRGKTKELDDTFEQRHKADEACFIREAAGIDQQLFQGGMATAVEEYLSSFCGGVRCPAGLSKNDSWLKGYRQKLNICVKKGWLTEREDGSYSKGSITDVGLAAILAQIFFRDKYDFRGEKVSRGGKDPSISIKQLEAHFHIKNLSSKRLKVKAETLKEFYI